MTPFNPSNPYDAYGGQQNAAMSEINITPFIDVMLVLLIIFMVAAPLMLGGVHVNLPKTASSPMPRPVSPTIVSIDAHARIFVDKDEIPDANRHIFFKELAQHSETGEVFVRGDGEIKYATMMELMSELGQAGFSRVTLVAAVNGTAATSADKTPSPASQTEPHPMKADQMEPHQMETYQMKGHQAVPAQEPQTQHTRVQATQGRISQTSSAAPSAPQTTSNQVSHTQHPKNRG